MQAALPEPDLSRSWSEAVAAAARHRRVVVLGATDMGKTTFIRAVLAGSGAAPRLIDLDPGQKMIGPPGTVGQGHPELERFVFIGTTSASALSAIARAAATLAEGAEPFIVNTAGFVTGIGARLQSMTLAAIQPDLIVRIGGHPVLAVAAEARVLALAPSPLALRKTPACRRALRQAAFERELEGASILAFDQMAVQPALPKPWDSPARPICSVADAKGIDLALGIVEAMDGETLFIRARAPVRPVRLVRLGKMWAEPGDGRWRLRDKLEPSWA